MKITKVKLMRTRCCIKNTNGQHCPALTFCDQVGKEVEALGYRDGFYFERGAECKDTGDTLRFEVA